MTEDLDLHFRSSVLRAFPRVRLPVRLKTFLRRLAVVLGVAALVVLLVCLVRFRWLPERGAGYPIYWLHDHVYLFLKGLSFTRSFPYSLVWWGTAAILLAVVLVSMITSFLVAWSLLGSAYVWLAAKVVRSPRLAGPLVALAKFQRWMGWEPKQLLKLIERERALELARLAGVAPLEGGDQACRVLQNLTELQIRLSLSHKSGVAERLEAASWWQEAFLQSQLLDDAESATELANTIWLVVGPLLERGRVTAVKNSVFQAADFTPAVLARDLLCLAYQADRQIVDPRIVAAKAPALAIDARKLDLSWLVEAVKARHQEMNRLLVLLEQSIRFGRLPEGLVGLERAWPEGEDDLWPAIGRLSLGIALSLAAVKRKPALQSGKRGDRVAPQAALSYLDTVEALALALEIAPPSVRDKALRAIAVAEKLVKGLPRTEDYVACSKLADIQLADRRRQTESFAVESGLRLAEMRADSLRVAAGPEVSPRFEAGHREAR